MSSNFSEVEWPVNPKLKPFLTILVSEPIKEGLVKLFCRATKFLDPIIRPIKIKVIFTRKHFMITVNDNMVACRVHELLIYDLSKIERITDERYIIAAFMEEFVHCYLDSEDEDLAARKVVELYPELVYDQKLGKYFPRP